MRRLAWCVLASVLIAGCCVSVASATPPTPPFRQCPPVHADTSCGALIVVDSKQHVIGYYDPNQGPYDGNDDTLVGVTNKSTKIVHRIALNGSSIFAFDSDGLCTYVNCTWPHVYGYEGPQNTFTRIDDDNGFVDFPNGLAPGKSTYFSLETTAPFQPFVVVHPSNLDHSDFNKRDDIGGLDFGPVQMHATLNEMLTITNGGTAPLKINNAATGLGTFDVVGGTCMGGAPVDPDESCTIKVAFRSPVGSTFEYATDLTIYDNTPNQSENVSLRATAVRARPHMLDAEVGPEQAVPSPAPNPCNTHMYFGNGFGWGMIPGGPQWLAGQVVEGHIATEDANHAPGGPQELHFNADYNFFVYPDQGYRNLLVPANFLVTSEFTESEVGRIEVEWEREFGGREGMPQWAWPNIGDKVLVNGWHILDCSHGGPDYRTEIHPPLFVATYRNAALSPLGTMNGAPMYGRLGSFESNGDTEASLVDVFASSYGGGAYGNEIHRQGWSNQPISGRTFTFDVMAPPRPSSTAVLGNPEVTPLRASPGVNLSWTRSAQNINGYTFTLTFPTLAPNVAQAYGAHVRVRWTDPLATQIPVHEFIVQPIRVRVINDLVKFITAHWGFYGYVNDEGKGSMFTGGGMNVNNELFADVRDGDIIDLRHVRPFHVFTVENEPLRVSFRASRFDVAYGLWPICTQCGHALPAGTASAFYDPTKLPLGTITRTLTSDQALAGGLGDDEWDTRCPCFDITFSITKRK